MTLELSTSAVSWSDCHYGLMTAIGAMVIAAAILVDVWYRRRWWMATAGASARVRHAQLIVLSAICLSRSSVAAEDYAYPYHDPYVATITAAILNADAFAPRLGRQVIHVPGLRGRNQLPSLEGRGDLSVALYRQRHPAPLLFVLAGVGTNPYFGLATYFAGLFHREGFHVVTLPSPMSWNFALAASRSGVPGDAPEDARDLYEVMQRILSVLRTQHNVKVTEIHFLGASLGALEGAHLSLIDADERKIGIEKYLLVNPPLDLSYALTRIDEWYARGEKLGAERSKDIVGKALAIVEAFAKERGDDPAVFDRLVKSFAGFTREDLQFLLAADLRASLPELVYATQAVHDQNILKAARDQTRKRLQEAQGITFIDYRGKIAVPLWRVQAAEPRADLGFFTRRGSLAAILERLRGNPRIQIMHNADDFTSERHAIEGLKAALGNQVMLYSYGGHLGNLWYPENKDCVLRRFRSR